MDLRCFRSRWMGLMPSPGRLYSSFLVLHEWIGILWYRIRYR